MNNTFAQQLRCDRLARGLTQDQLAVQSDVSQAAISQLETGHTTVPDQMTVGKLQTVLPLEGWSAARVLFETLARQSGQTVEQVVAAMRRSGDDYDADPPPSGRADYDAQGERIADGDAAAVFTVSGKHPAEWAGSA